MSKTYPLTATLNTGHLNGSDYMEPNWSNFLTWNDASSNKGYAGYDSPYWRYATNMLFDQSTLSSLRTKVGNGVTVTGLTLTVYCSQAMTGETLIGYKYNSTASGNGSSNAWARCNNDGTAGSGDNSVAFKIEAHTLSTGTQTFNLKTSTPYSGIPLYGLVAGPQTNVTGRWRFDSATLTVTTNELTVNYKKGSNGTGSDVSDVITPGGSLRGATYTRTGYTQTGWSTSDGGSKVYNLSATYSGTADLTLYPYWTAVTYTVNYNKGSYGSGTNTSDTKTYGVTLTLKGAIFTRTGYTQDGWATSDGGATVYALSGSYTANAGATLYPHWKADTYAVTYNANGGTGTTSSQTKTYGVSLTLRANGFSRTGYAFQHWNTKADGSGTTYAAGASYAANAAVTLYAIWQATASTVSTTNGTLGTAQTITITRSNSSYTHNLSCTYGTQTMNNFATGVGTSYSWTPDPSLAAGFPNATSGTCTITCVTMSGSTTIGTTTTTCTLSIPDTADYKPSVSTFTATHHSSNSAVNGASWGGAGYYTKGYSYATLSVAGGYTLKGGATLKSIAFSGPGVNASPGSATSVNTSVLTTINTNTWTVTVTDSRNRTASKQVSVTVYDYAPPTVSGIVVARTDSSGNVNNASGTYISMTPSYSISSVGSPGKNSISTQTLKFSLHGSGTPIWTQNPCASGTTYNPRTSPYAISLTSAYDVTVTVADAVQAAEGKSTTYTVTLPTVQGLWFGKGNDRLGLGGVPEGAGLYCDWDATFKGVVDVVPRRCFATLASQGWYRVLKLEGQNFAMGGTGYEIDLVIAREYWSTSNEIHSIKFQCAENQYIFSNESSASNSVLVDKIRYVRETNNIGYIDIHYTTSASNAVYVGFTVHNNWQDCFVAMGLATAPDSPSALTIREYTFAANTKQYSSGTESGVEYVIHRNGNLVQLRIESAGGKSCAQGQYTTVYTLPDWAKPYDTVYTAVDTYGGNNVICGMITAAGNVQIYPVNSTTGYYRFTVTYFVTK